MTQVVLVVREELGSNPHIAELRDEQAETFAREIELTATLTFLLEQHRAVHIDENDEESQREV